MSHTLKHLTRRTFMGLSAAGVIGLAITPVLAQEGEGNTTPIAPNFPQQDAAAVRAVVGASHGQVDRVKELVTARPILQMCSSPMVPDRIYLPLPCSQPARPQRHF